MSKMNKFTATFADCTTITRSSARDYAVAWRATWTSDDGRACAETGFASSREKASPYRPQKALASRHLSASMRAKAQRANADFLVRSGYQVEFAPAVRA
jgi:hypothetical protein